MIRDRYHFMKGEFKSSYKIMVFQLLNLLRRSYLIEFFWHFFVTVVNFDLEKFFLFELVIDEYFPDKLWI